MKKIIICLILIQIQLINFGQIIDHNCTVLKDIPVLWIETAKSRLHIACQFTSHGGQIIGGMVGLYYWKGNTYALNDGGSGGALDLVYDIMSGDLGNPDYVKWESLTRAYLSNPNSSDINVIMWTWCGELTYATEANVNTYLSLMSGLERDFPNVKFIYMTGHLDGTGLLGNLHLINEQIRAFCRKNNKILYDFADIEAYDPDGVYYGDKHPSDGCNYDHNGNGVTEQTGDPALPIGSDKNWAIDWQNTHTVNVDWYNTEVAHTQPLNGNRKAYAAWWLWARLAGWNGGAIPVAGITVTGANGYNTITTVNGTLQLSAEVSPANATDKTIIWSIENGTGQASISSTGLVKAITNGTVIARATSNDGSGVYGMLVITIDLLTDIDVYKTEQAKISLNRDEIMIQLDDNYLFAKLSLFNLKGCLIATKNIINNISIINISNLPSGIYIISLSKSKILTTFKIIIP